MGVDYRRFSGTRHRNLTLAHRALSLLTAAMKPWRIHILTDRNSFSLAEMSSMLQRATEQANRFWGYLKTHSPLQEDEPELG